MRVNDIEVRGEGTALQVLESSGYDVRSECRSGFCGACRLKAKGKPIYQQEPIGYCSDDEVLVCCLDSQSDINIEL
ncbi:2Fe-2S iron-sulfur cluster binding domain-containing protein [Vibrio sp. SCSIO 43140]|uniref:2Fe-2S iron-sulfur cluster-binding protein n=1 Tax=Vibrio sp. SCSIO 43140 TaxID=2819100 RepID=UPI002075E1A5|nr:2Fe-2S iron-sulfur cluster-binding protein [Vibrio sp. SCSIO 43140]USD58869.1 2Fe-2S iron-sulfur cluster binding domain-containing protein [Vibrio sp. SCSIO 43140]